MSRHSWNTVCSNTASRLFQRQRSRKWNWHWKKKEDAAWYLTLLVCGVSHTFVLCKVRALSQWAWSVTQVSVVSFDKHIDCQTFAFRLHFTWAVFESCCQETLGRGRGKRRGVVEGANRLFFALRDGHSLAKTNSKPFQTTKLLGINGSGSAEAVWPVQMLCIERPPCS